MHLICDPCPETCGTDKISECPIIIKVKKRRATRIRRKILIYNPKGNLAQTAQLILAFTEVNHASTKDHIERVALLAEAVAKVSKKDAKAAFFGGLLHDAGKIILPANLFDGHNITPEEYEYVKTHAKAGFKVLYSLHKFTALCAGFHHRLYEAGYGADMKDFPSNWSPTTVKKVLEISTIISICDFVEAFTTRKTKIFENPKQIQDNPQAAELLKKMLNTSDAEPPLKMMLYKKYPNDMQTVDVVLALKDKILQE